MLANLRRRVNETGAVDFGANCGNVNIVAALHILNVAIFKETLRWRPLWTLFRRRQWRVPSRLKQCPVARSLDGTAQPRAPQRPQGANDIASTDARPPERS